MARYLCLPLIVLVLLLSGGSPAAAPAAAAADPVQGDVTCDSSVTAVDSLQILRDVAGLGTTAQCLADAGDVNCDGAVNSVDSLRILRYVAGLTNTAVDGCVPIGDPLEIRPNSYQLIQAALDAGDIDAETALTYKIFVTFSDLRLPAAYQGDDGAVWDDPMAVAQAASTWDTLSPATQAVLAPFILPPDAPGSWQQQVTAGSVRALANSVTYNGDASSPHVIIWYREDRPQDEVLARTLANEVDANIWTQLTGLMGPPKPDTGRPNNYDDRIDVFLSGDATRAFAASIPPCNETSGYIVLGAPYSDKYVLTHELMHVIDYHFKLSTCWYDEYRWIHEATSQWSMDFVYPGDQKERGPRVPSCFLDRPMLSLEYRDDCHEYAAYLLPFYLHRNHDKQYIRKIWDAFVGNDSLEGVNAALAPLGGLTDVWPKFTTENYNRELQTKYKTDGITEKAALEVKEDVTLGGGAMRKYVLRGDVDHMAALYHQYKFVDPAIKEVTFKHSLKGQPTAFVRALIKYQGDAIWKIEDWTGDSEKKFCYDDPGQKKFESLVIIISNSEYQNRSHILTSDPQPELIVKDQCGITGTVTGTYHSSGAGYTEDWTVTADVEWVEDEGYFGGLGRVFFPEGDIDWEWSVDYTDEPCHDTASGHLVAGQGLVHVGQQWLVLWDDPANPDRYYYSGHGYVPAMWHNACQNSDRKGMYFWDVPEPNIDISTTTPTLPATPPVRVAASAPLCRDATWTVAADATSITGSCFDHNEDYGYEKYEWDFKLAVAAP